MSAPLTEFKIEYYNEACSRCESEILAFLKAKDELDRPSTRDEFLDQCARYRSAARSYRSYWSIRESYNYGLIDKDKYGYFLTNLLQMYRVDSPYYRHRLRLLIRAMKADQKGMKEKKPKAKVIK